MAMMTGRSHEMLGRQPEMFARRPCSGPPRSSDPDGTDPGGPDPDGPELGGPDPGGGDPGGPDPVLEALERLSGLLTDEVLSKLAGGGNAESPALAHAARPAAADGHHGRRTGRAGAAPSPGADGRAAAPRGIAIRPGARVGPTGKLLTRILEHYPKRHEIYITSAYRPEEPGSHHGGLSYRGSPTAAIDIGAGGVTPGRIAPHARRREVALRPFRRRHRRADPYHAVQHRPRLLRQEPAQVSRRRALRPGTRRRASQPRPFRMLQGARAEDPRATRQRPRSVDAHATPRRSGGGMPAATTGSAGRWISLPRAGRHFVLHPQVQRRQHVQGRANTRQGLERARAARHSRARRVPRALAGQADQGSAVLLHLVNTQTPWWRNVPWIWQLDAEKFERCRARRVRLKARSSWTNCNVSPAARATSSPTRRAGYIGDSFTIGFDLWASDYSRFGRAAAVQGAVQGRSGKELAAVQRTQAARPAVRERRDDRPAEDVRRQPVRRQLEGAARVDPGQIRAGRSGRRRHRCRSHGATRSGGRLPAPALPPGRADAGRSRIGREARRQAAGQAARRARR